MQRVASILAEGNGVIGIGSPRASVEANFLLRELVGADHFAPGFSTRQQALVELALRLRRDSRAALPDIRGIESADAVLVLGEDVTNTAPRIALALRQSVRNEAFALAAELQLQPWQDEAVRTLAQDRRSPLYIAAVGDTPLDDVAAARVSLAPDDIARLGLAVAASVAGAPAAHEGERTPALAAQIAAALTAAQRPLVVSGTGSGSGAVMEAAAQVSEALCAAGKAAMLCLALPEANAMGQALLCGPGALDLAGLTARAASGDIDTLIVLENDLYRRGPRAEIEGLLAACRHVIVLDGMDNATTSAATLALPAASHIESEGTLVSLEGRAQRHYPVFQPPAERYPGWMWLLACMKELERTEVRELQHFDDIIRACAARIPALAGITAAAPDHHYRNAGVRVPRQPHRYSGRTAMHADLSVHEPQQPVDEESPLAFSMEGLNRDQPGALLPFVWTPGWNSNQGVFKFETAVGGPLRGGTAGARLFEPGAGVTATAAFAPFAAQPGTWQLVPRQRIFGSDELSALSPGICELVQPGYLELCAADAASLGVGSGDGVTVGDDLATLEVRVNDTLVPGCAGYAEGHAGTANLAPLARVSLRRAPQWQRHSAQLIGSDGGGGHV